MRFELIFPNGEREETTIEMVDAPSIKRPMEWLLRAQQDELAPCGITLDSGLYIGILPPTVQEELHKVWRPM